jgi:hypothetical protein
LGVQGAQFGIQCSVAGATVEGTILGYQTVNAAKLIRQNAQGVVAATPIQMTAGAQSVILTGLIITPGSGSPVIGVQIKGVQASQAWYTKANAFIKVMKTA